MAPTPGILYVTMQPEPSLPPAQFHDWYNNEHGPTRLRLPFVSNGFRYRAQGQDPEWMAIYDIVDNDELTKEPYTRLRTDAVKSQREKETMKQIKVDRKILDLVGSRAAKHFRKLEEVKAEGEKNCMVAVSFCIPAEKEQEVERWYEEEHIDMLSKVPGWLRTRRFVTSRITPEDKREFLALHEFAPKNGLGGKEHKASMNTPWQKEIMENTMSEKRRYVYDLYYTFGPAPRDLAPLSSEDCIGAFKSPDKLTRTFPASDGVAAIESFVTTSDGVDLPYRLEGCTDSDAPLIVLDNSILVNWGIWDGFIAAFFKHSQNKKYRILRFQKRGRSSQCGDRPITIDVLSSDVITLLDALRVPKAAAVIGVSLGGAATLNTALKYPDRVAAFVCCDMSSKSPAGNSKIWGERIAMAEKEDAKASSGEPIVGSELAEVTVKRWFVPENHSTSELQRLKEMVATNSLEGFKRSVQALFEYDMKPLMKEGKAKGAFVVGDEDGVLPKTMEEMAEAYGEKGAEYQVIEKAGHLPMVEQPEEFAEFVTQFLGS
ncbi:hypothetical protein LTR66_010940 [Elasticomyces elasticus]|nr:hypothetical protein LTR66_010940 [Elasticomyces elasticus]